MFRKKNSYSILNLSFSVNFLQLKNKIKFKKMCDVFQPKIDLCKEFWRICKYGSAFTNIYYDQVNIWILHNSELDIKRPKNVLKD